MVRIAWISRLTGDAGHGEWRAPFVDDESIIDRLNQEHPEIVHWIERKE
jgi:hypothetical protein